MTPRRWVPRRMTYDLQFEQLKAWLDDYAARLANKPPLPRPDLARDIHFKHGVLLSIVAHMLLDPDELDRVREQIAQHLVGADPFNPDDTPPEWDDPPEQESEADRKDRIEAGKADAAWDDHVNRDEP